MCGRFLITTPLEAIKDWFPIETLAPVPPNDNAAPTQNLGVVAQGPDLKLHLAAMQWGLVPAWADEIKASARNINARSETLLEKPSFKEPAQTRRCLVPANGFYEWQTQDKAKTPYMITWPEQPLFFFLGVWDLWQNAQQSLFSFALITRQANPSISKIHHRMPIMVTADQGRDWLETNQVQRSLDRLSYLSAQVAYSAKAVDTQVNSVPKPAKPKRQASLF